MSGAMWRMVCAVAAIGALVGACSGGDSGAGLADNPFVDDEPGAENDSGRTEQSDRVTNRFVALASLFPERLGEQVVFVSDLELAADQAGVERRCEDDDEAARSVASLSVPVDGVDLAPGALLPQEWSNVVTFNGDMRIAFGFGPCDIDAAAEDFTVDVPDRIAVARTSRVGAIGDAVRSDPAWSDLLREADPDREVAPGVAAGGATYVWGDDPVAIDIERRTPARPLGRGGALHVDEDAGVVIRSVDVPVIDAALGTRADGSSLADDQDALALLDAAAELGAHTVVLARPTVRAQWLPISGITTGEGAEELLAAAEEMPLPARADWMAAAWSLDTSAGSEGAIVVHLLAAHDDAAAAEAAVPAMEQFLADGMSFRSSRPWGELFGPTTVEASGPLLITTSELEVWPSFVLQSIFSRDSLFVVD